MKRTFDKKILLQVILICLFQLSIVSSVDALLPLQLNGTADISYGETENNNNSQEFFQQKYSVNWSKNFLSNLSFRSAYRYDKSEITRNSTNPIWVEQQTPDADLVWNNASFVLLSRYNYRKTNNPTNKQLQLSRKSISFDFKTKSITYPNLNLRFSRDHSYNHYDLDYQNLFERRYQAELHYSYKGSILHYSFTRRYNENRMRSLKSTQNSHLLRLSDTKIISSKLKMSSSYTMTYKEQSDERTSDILSDYYVLQLSSAIYAQTNNTTLDSLYIVRDLSDGNVEDPAIPLIDIGGTSINNNIGVDFGYEQEVGAIYLYVDQYTDKRIWDVYTSSDNINWELHTYTPSVLFNSLYSRLEITFPEDTTRYIKVVNSDISDITHTYVTEIEALEERGTTVLTKSSSSTHLISTNAIVNHSKKVSSMVDASYQHLPGQFGSKQRDNLNYSLSTRFYQTNKLSHNFRFQHDMQFLHGAALDVVNYGANYHLTYKVLEKLELNLSSSMRLDYIDNVKNNENKSILFGTIGTPLPGLNLSANFTYAKNTQNLSERVFYTGYQRYNMDGRVSRALTISANYSHRNTKYYDYLKPENTLDNIYTDQYVISFRLRATRTIFVRSSFNINHGNGYYFSQNYMLSWSPSRKLSISSQAKFQNDDNITLTERYNTQLNYKLARNTNLYVSYLSSNLTESIRAGFRTGL